MRPYLLGYGLLCLVLAALVVATQVRARVDGTAALALLPPLVGLAIGPLLGQARPASHLDRHRAVQRHRVVLILLPWLGPRLEAIDPGSMRTRLAVTFGLTAALALVLVVVVDANREETSIRNRCWRRRSRWRSA